MQRGKGEFAGLRPILPQKEAVTESATAKGLLFFLFEAKGALSCTINIMYDAGPLYLLPGKTVFSRRSAGVGGVPSGGPS